MPTYNVKGKTVVKWDIQVDAMNEEDACEKACEEAESELAGDGLESESEVDSIQQLEKWETQ